MKSICAKCQYFSEGGLDATKYTTDVCLATTTQIFDYIIGEWVDRVEDIADPNKRNHDGKCIYFKSKTTVLETMKRFCQK